QIIANGNMEALDARGGPAAWSIPERAKGQVQAITEAGNRFVRLSNDDDSKTVYLEQKFKIDPSWNSVTASARMRANNLNVTRSSKQDVRVNISFRDAGDNRVGPYQPLPALKSDSPMWVQRSATLAIPDGAAT